MPSPIEASNALMMPDPSSGGMTADPMNVIHALRYGLQAGAKNMAPNLYGLMSGEPAPPINWEPNAAGKVNVQDPRISGALGEEANIASLAAGAIPGVGEIPLAARAASAVAPKLSQLAPRLANIGSKMAQGAESTLTSPGALAGLGVSAAGTSEAGAAPKLNRAQQQELELQRQKAQAGTEAEIAKAKGLSDIQFQQQQQTQELASQHEKEQLERSFRDRYPQISNAMAMSGLAMSALVPYGTRMAQMGTYNRFMKDFHGLAQRAEEALATGNKDRAQLLANGLLAAGKQAKAFSDPSKVGPLSTVAGALAPLEMQRAPELMDVVSGSPQAKAQAEGKLTDPSMLLGLGTGVAGGMLGAKAPLLRSKMTEPVGYEGIAKALKAVKKTKGS